MDAGTEALRLAERTGAAIGVTINGKGAIPSSHPLCVGATLSFAPVVDMIRAADVLVAVGTEFSELDWWGLDAPLELTGRLIRIDIDAAQLQAQFGADVALHGDSRSVLGALADRLTEAPPGDSSAAADRVARALAALEWPSRSHRAQPLLDMLDAALPEDRIVTADSTQPAYAANHMLGVERPAVMDDARRIRHARVCVANGDRREALPPPTGRLPASPATAACCSRCRNSPPPAIWDWACRSSFGTTMAMARSPTRCCASESSRIGTAASPHDLVAIARGFGCEAASTRSMDEASSLITAALDRDRPTLIEVRP